MRMEESSIELIDENQELRERIDKAIEYIENHQPTVSEFNPGEKCSVYYEEQVINEIKKILKGKENE